MVSALFDFKREILPMLHPVRVIAEAGCSDEWAPIRRAVATEPWAEAAFEMAAGC